MVYLGWTVIRCLPRLPAWPVNGSGFSKTGGGAVASVAGMRTRTVPSVRAQPMAAVADVEKSSRWYQRVLGATSGHGGTEYELLLVDGEPVMQLHQLEVGHHHGALGDPELPLGNGVALWFETDEFDAAVRRIRDVPTEIVTDVHVNPNAGHREIWLRDPDGYLVVVAEPTRY